MDGGSGREKTDLSFREATETDVDQLLALVNAAYDREKQWKKGERTNREELLSYISSPTSCILVGYAQEADKGDAEGVSVDVTKEMVSSILLRIPNDACFFGMLSVWPHMQDRGIGKETLIYAERYVKEAKGCNAMECVVADFNSHLFPYYEKKGYTKVGEEPWQSDVLLVPAFFCRYRKELN